MSLARSQCAAIQEEVVRGDLTPGQASEKALRMLCDKLPTFHEQDSRSDKI